MMKKPTISTALVQVLLNHLEKQGIRAQEILGDASIDLDRIETMNGRIPLDRFMSIWQAVAKKMGAELLGLSFGEALAHHYPGGNILFGVMSNAPTLKEALEKFCRYHDIMADAVKPALTVTDEWVHFSFEVVINSSLAAPKEISEVLLATYAVILRRLTDGKLKLEEVRCRHSKPSDIRIYNQTFHAPVSFEQRRNEVIFARAYLDLPIFLSDPRLLTVLDELAESLLKDLDASETWSSRVADLLGTVAVQGEVPTIANVSTQLGMSTRTLQHRLKQEGQTFRSLLNRIRRKIAMDVLNKDRMNLCELAFLLGYSEQSAFNHAFKRWTGRTPMQYRKNLQNGKRLEAGHY